MEPYLPVVSLDEIVLKVVQLVAQLRPHPLQLVDLLGQLILADLLRARLALHLRVLLLLFLLLHIRLLRPLRHLIDILLQLLVVDVQRPHRLLLVPQWEPPEDLLE